MNKFIALTATALIGLSSMGAMAAPILPASKAKAEVASHLTQSRASRFATTHTAGRVDAAVGRAVIDAPSGSVKEYMQSCSAYFAFWGDVYAMDDAGLAGQIVFDGNKVYIKNLISQFVTDTYVEGTLSGNTITVTFPQDYYFEYDADYDEELDVKIDLLEFIEDEEEAWYYPSTTKRSLTFTIDADGKITSEEALNGDYILGLVESGEWAGFGDWDIAFEPFNETIKTIKDIPADVVSALSPANFGYAEGAQSVKMCNKDGVFYMTGMQDIDSDIVITGTVAGSAMSISSRQYVGIDPDYNYRLFFDAVTVIEEYDEEWDETISYYTLEDLGGFTYDAASNTYSSNDTFIIGGGHTISLEAYNVYTKPEIKPIPDNIDPKPATPTNLTTSIYEAYGFGELSFDISNLNVDGYALNSADLYWRLYVDGSLYTFDPDDYYSLDHAMSDIPYNFDDDFDFLVSGNKHTVTLPTLNFKSLGVQVVNKAGGNEVASDIAVYGEGGVVAPSCADVASEVLYSPTGVALSADAKGLVIRRVTYTDGSVRCFKSFIK